MIKSLLTRQRPRMTNDILYNLLSTIPLTIKIWGAEVFFYISHVAVSRQSESSSNSPNCCFSTASYLLPTLFRELCAGSQQMLLLVYKSSEGSVKVHKNPLHFSVSETKVVWFCLRILQWKLTTEEAYHQLSTSCASADLLPCAVPLNSYLVKSKLKITTTLQGLSLRERLKWKFLL